MNEDQKQKIRRQDVRLWWNRIELYERFHALDELGYDGDEVHEDNSRGYSVVASLRDHEFDALPADLQEELIVYRIKG